ncbi:hypothetical protein B6N60_04156 [Richelia sinica FACHB-800]|uniref:Uncharacterized protein n=1 Tax=Richelia sinica FACHB-800 TaxID=1357546 RepID=A0A975Y6M6_9NOST|nr:CTB family bacteriocin [Richelia sinica]QXE25441.1 hypothetical protein B6N60_04156 [Richelia sinica FACHB-800]
MSSQLFTEVSVAEQEVIAGGIAQSINLSNFLSSLEYFGSSSSSGPNGTTTQSFGVRDQRFTSGLSVVNLGQIIAIPTLVFPTFP